MNEETSLHNALLYKSFIMKVIAPLLFVSAFLLLTTQQGYAKKAQYPKECVPQKQYCVDVEIADAITQVTGAEYDSTELGVSLLNLSAKENNGSAYPNENYNPVDKTTDYGAMMINTKNLPLCAERLGGTAESVKKRMLGGDTLFSVQCALVVFKYQSEEICGKSKNNNCQTFAAKLCSYNKGGGWCCGGSGYKPRPTEGCSDYSTIACNRTGTDCDTGLIGNNPYTGQPNVGVYKAPKGLSNVTTPHVPLNCPNLAVSQAMDQARRLYRSQMLTTTMDTYKQALEYDWKNADKVKDLRRHPEDQYCIAWLYESFDLYRWLAESGSKMAALIEQAVEAVVSQLANWACKAVATAINTALSMMCVPIPSFSFGLDLPMISAASASCNGFSLNDVMRAQAGRPFGPSRSIPSLNYGLRRVVPNMKTEKLEVF